MVVMDNGCPLCCLRNSKSPESIGARPGWRFNPHFKYSRVSLGWESLRVSCAKAGQVSESRGRVVRSLRPDEVEGVGELSSRQGGRSGAARLVCLLSDRQAAREPLCAVGDA